MSNELFDENPGAKDSFIASILGEYSAGNGKGKNDVAGDWGDEDIDVDQLIADCPFPAEELPRKESSEELLQLSPADGMPDLWEHNWFGKMLPTHQTRAQDLLRKIGVGAETGLRVSKKRLRNHYHIKMKYDKVEGNGFGVNTDLACRMALDKFALAFNRVYFPESEEMDPTLQTMPSNLREFCAKKKLPAPKFVNTSVDGVYHSVVSVGSESEEGKSSRCLTEAKGIASKMWLDFNGGNWKEVIRAGKVNIFEEELELMNCSPEHRIGEYSPKKKKSSYSQPEDKLRADSIKGAQLLSRLRGLVPGDSGNRSRGRSPRSKLLTKEIFDSSCSSVASDSHPVSPVKTSLLDFMEPVGPDSSIFSGEQNITRKKKSSDRRTYSSIDTSQEENDLLREFSPVNGQTARKQTEREPSFERVTDVEEARLAREEGSSFDTKSSDESEAEDNRPLFSKAFSPSVRTTSTPKTKEVSERCLRDRTPKKVDRSKPEEIKENFPQVSSELKRSSTRQAGIQKYQEISKKCKPSLEGSPSSKKETQRLFKFDSAAKQAYAEEITRENKKKKKKSAAKSKPPPSEAKGSDVFLEEFPEDDFLKQAKEKMKKIRQEARKKSRRDEHSPLSEAEDLPSTAKRKRKNDLKETGQKSIKGFLKSSQSVDDSSDKQSLVASYVLGSPPPLIPEKSCLIDHFPEVEENIRKLDRNLETLAREKAKDEEEMTDNALKRDRIQSELDEKEISRLFDENLTFLKGIWSGDIESDRRNQYLKDGGARQALLYRMITSPFTDQQLDWTLDLISKVWMRNKRERTDNSDYVWKVLLPECFIKFYMDFFSLSKEEAEQRINNTPLNEEDDFNF